MNKIASFTIDHQKLKRGLYVSRRDVPITTFDLRMRRPYLEPVLSPTEAHSLEHLLATALRGGPCRKHVVYVGPMGCATGFYVLYSGIPDETAVRDIVAAFQRILSAESMPGDSERECGNRRTLDLAAGKKIAEEYLKTIMDQSKPDKYPENES